MILFKNLVYNIMSPCNVLFVLIFINFFKIFVQTSQVATDESLVHHDYSSMEIYLKELHEKCPSITRLYSIGKSTEGRELYVMEITNNPGKHDVNKPEMKYVGNIHGNEVVGKEILLQLLKVLCTQYGIDERITNIVNSVRLHILPSINPDGYQKAFQLKIERPTYDSSSLSRRNKNRKDLNRNFPGLGDECLSLLGRQPETQAVMRWTAELPFVLSADLHGGIIETLYPYGSTEEYTPDDAVFKTIASNYSSTHETMHVRPCLHWFSHLEHSYSRIIKLYAAYNNMADYNYVCSNTFEIVLELSCSKFPETEDLYKLWLQNKEALLMLIETSRKGIHGFVHSTDGQPIANAEIIIDSNTKSIITAENGDYWRLMIPGDYNITARHSGYKSNTTFIHIPSNTESSLETFILNFTLIPESVSEYASKYDFGLLSNFEPGYLNNSELYDRLNKLEIEYPNNFIKFNDMNDKNGRYKNEVIHSWKLTGNLGMQEDDKFHIALLGGLYASQPIGREIILRLITHLLTGKRNNDPDISDFMNDVVLHIIPALDPGFDDVKYKCNPSTPNELGRNLLNVENYENVDTATLGFKNLLDTARYDAIISIISNGIGVAYTNEFFGEFKDIANEYRKSMRTNNCQSSNISNEFGNFIYDKFNIPSITLSLSCCKYPPANLIPNIWQDNVLPLKKLLFRLANGIILNVIDENGNTIRNSQLQFFRDLSEKSFHTIFQNSRVIKQILPLGSVYMKITHQDLSSSVISKNLDMKILRNTIVLLNTNYSSSDAMVEN